jgi:hypothetical protein
MSLRVCMGWCAHLTVMVGGVVDWGRLSMLDVVRAWLSAAMALICTPGCSAAHLGLSKSSAIANATTRATLQSHGSCGMSAAFAGAPS